MEGLDKKLPVDPSWKVLYEQECEPAQRDYVGVITDEAELRRKLSLGYWLTNWDEDGCALFNPAPMNGLHCYVTKPLAEVFAPTRRRRS